MRFLGLGLADPVPDANTIWRFREALTRATLGGRAGDRDAFRGLRGGPDSGRVSRDGWPGRSMPRSSRLRSSATRTPRSGRLRKGASRPRWAAKPAKLAQKDREARWTVKWSKAEPADDGFAAMDLAVPAFGYKNHVGIDRRHGLIRTWWVTDAARHDGAQLRALISKAITAVTYGAIRPIARVRTRGSWLRTDFARRSTARSRRASRCRSTWHGRMGSSRGCELPSSMCSRTRRGR